MDEAKRDFVVLRQWILENRERSLAKEERPPIPEIKKTTCRILQVVFYFTLIPPSLDEIVCSADDNNNESKCDNDISCSKCKDVSDRAQD